LKDTTKDRIREAFAHIKVKHRPWVFEKLKQIHQHADKLEYLRGALRAQT
jgi:hypothetical protein